MDKQMYKELVAEHMRRNAKLEEKNLELEQKIQSIENYQEVSQGYVYRYTNG